MNTLVNLWNVITRLTQSLARTVELVDTINASSPAHASAAQPSPVVPVDETAIAQRIRREIAEETLNEFDEKWKETIGLPDDKGVIPDTQFRQGL